MTAARLVEPKNLELLIEAGRLLQEMNFIFKISIFGDGPLYKKLKSKIKEYHLEDIILMHGFSNNMPRIIRLFDVFILTSKHEGLPMALLEAMALKTPVICTAVGGMKEVMKDGINGLLIRSDDPYNIVEAVLRIKNSPNLSRKLAENAKKTIEKEYSITRNVEKLIFSYEQLL